MKAIDICGYEGLYSVDEYGRIYSYRSNAYLTPGKTHTGYSIVTLYKAGGRETCSVHRLVARAFVPNPNKLSEVNHKDGDKTNNCADNLEWCTRRQNVIHAYKTGLREGDGKAKQRYREKCKRLVLEFYPTEANLIAQVEKQPAKQTYIKNLIRKDIAAGSDPFMEALAALRALGVDSSMISLHLVFGDRVAVELGGEYFGVWDTVRKTFVD